MYLVTINDGDVIESMTIVWLKSNPNNGTLYGCKEDEAEAIEVNGIVYKLIEKEYLSEYPQATVEEVSDGDYIERLKASEQKNRADIDYIAVMSDIEL